jgi:phenylpropionate dioxygenase-like ring-hydroxylating dioxygenase large terminal subunit
VYPSTEAYGHVWAALDTPDLDLPDMPEALDPDWQFEHGRPTDVTWGLRQVTENFRDMSHFAFVHRSSIGPNVQQVVDPYRVQRDGVKRIRAKLGVGNKAELTRAALLGRLAG